MRQTKKTIKKLSTVFVIITSPLLSITQAQAATENLNKFDQVKTVEQTANPSLVLGSNANNLKSAGDVIKVSGSGFDEDKGYYLTLCVKNQEGVRPAPCVGQNGHASGNAKWFNSNPNQNFAKFTEPFEENGSFDVNLNVKANNERFSCKDTLQGCVIAVRLDHFYPEDTSADRFASVTFVD